MATGSSRFIVFPAAERGTARGAEIASRAAEEEKGPVGLLESGRQLVAVDGHVDILAQNDPRAKPARLARLARRFGPALGQEVLPVEQARQLPLKPGRAFALLWP